MGGRGGILGIPGGIIEGIPGGKGIFGGNIGGRGGTLIPGTIPGIGIPGGKVVVVEDDNIGRAVILGSMVFIAGPPIPRTGPAKPGAGPGKGCPLPPGIALLVPGPVVVVVVFAVFGRDSTRNETTFSPRNNTKPR